MIGKYLQRMYPANAMEVSEMVNGTTHGENEWLVESPGALQQWVQTKGIINVYI